MIEEWRPVVGFEGRYEVSNTGLVRNVVKGRLLKPGFDKNGYLKCVLSKDRKPRTLYIHRLVASAFIENPLNLPQVNHRDEDKTNNKVDNLEWCTSKYNVNYGSAQERRVQKNIDNGNYSGFKTADIKEYIREYARRYREEHKEEVSEYMKEYQNKRKEHLKEYKKRYYQENKEKRNEYMKEYNKKNKEKIMEYQREYRRRKHSKKNDN